MAKTTGNNQLHVQHQSVNSWSCFGNSDYQELTNVPVVDWSSGGYQAAIDVWAQHCDQPQPDVIQLSPHSVDRTARCPTVDPYFEWAVADRPVKESSNRDYRSVSPSVLRWKQWRSAGRNWRRRISTRSD